jgi:RHS repeat-associated protein
MATVVNHIRYDSFGKITSETNAAVDFLFAYTGRERDEETGLYYYRARYYDPAVGRFVSEDPMGFAAGDTNLVRYVGNSPIYAFDPTGLVQQFRFVEVQEMRPSEDLLRMMDATKPLYQNWYRNVIMSAFPVSLVGGEKRWDLLDYLANLGAGFGDSLTLQGTYLVREALGINDGVDPNSWTSFSGAAVEMAGELTVTMGGAYLRHAAKKAMASGVKTSVARQHARAFMKRLHPGLPSELHVHHKHTLVGHPPPKGQKGRVPSHWPTIGLPESVYNHPWNLMIVDAKKHSDIHKWLVRWEWLVYYGSRPYLTAARAGATYGVMKIDAYMDQMSAAEMEAIAGERIIHADNVPEELRRFELRRRLRGG